MALRYVLVSILFRLFTSFVSKVMYVRHHNYNRKAILHCQYHSYCITNCRPLMYYVLTLIDTYVTYVIKRLVLAFIHILLCSKESKARKLN